MCFYSPAVCSSPTLCCPRPWTTTMPSGRRDRSFPVLSTHTSWKRSSQLPGPKPPVNQILQPPPLRFFPLYPRLHHFCLVRPATDKLQILSFWTSCHLLVFMSIQTFLQTVKTAQSSLLRPVSLTTGNVFCVWSMETRTLMWVKHISLNSLKCTYGWGEQSVSLMTFLCFFRRADGCCTSVKTSGPMWTAPSGRPRCLKMTTALWKMFTWLFSGENSWWDVTLLPTLVPNLFSVHSLDRHLQPLLLSFQRCEKCQKSGATVSCCLTSCTSNYHFMCARQCHCIFLEDKKVYCPKHRDLIKGEVRKLYYDSQAEN